MLVRLAEAQTSFQELAVEMVCLGEANVLAATSRGVATHLERQLPGAQVHRDCHLAALQAPANADWDMLRAAFKDCIRLQSFLKPE